MGGGLMQLVAYGAQDVYLTGNPQITFFKVVYRRHTNFAMESIEQVFNGTPSLGGKSTVPITRNGDLVSKMWLKTTVSTTDTLVQAPASATGYQYIIPGSTPTVDQLAHSAAQSFTVECVNANVLTLTISQNFTNSSIASLGTSDTVTIAGMANSDYNGTTLAITSVTTAQSPGSADGVYLVTPTGGTASVASDETSSDGASDIVTLNFTGSGTTLALNHADTKTITAEATAVNEITITVSQNFADSEFNVVEAVGDILFLEGFTNSSYNGYFTINTVTQTHIGRTYNGVYVCDAPGITATAAAEASDAVTHKITVNDKTNNDFETFSWGTDLGYSLIDSVELQIGGTKIDKHYGRWMHVWSQLTRTSEHTESHTAIISPETSTTTSHSLYVPLQFFCCRNDGLALPLIALQYHDVRLEFDFQTGQNTIVNLQSNGTTVGTKGGNVSISNTSLLVNYIYLDSEERKRFAQASHEYLIEQLQFTGQETISGTNSKIRLNFNHPVKELIWAVEKTAANLNHFNFTNNVVQSSGSNPLQTAVLQLNGHDRFEEEDGKFFNYLQPHTHHSRTPAAGINVYSFALNPEEHQPSGSCNFSRIDNATLTVTTASAGTSMYVYGVNYNVLRIMSGMGGVAYSN